MDSTTSLLDANGHSSPLQDSALTTQDAPYASDSELSEAAVPNRSPSPASSPNNQSEFGAQDSDDSDASAAELIEQSDADFDMEDSPAPQALNTSRQDRSSSAESHRPAKRKVVVEDDEHIKANPELYGLRRSVRVQYHTEVRN